jgi:DNA invertase Pin-like site-specific DNA recombinase
MTKRVGIYVRVSCDEQTLDTQREALMAVAGRNGWHVVETFEDDGVSGAKGRAQRPGFDRLCRAVVCKDINVVAAWSVDRLGRSLQDLVAFLGELQAKDCGLFLHQQGVDTSTPSGRALFAMLSIFSEFEREMIVARVKAGMARARRAGKHLGRPHEVSPAKACLIVADRRAGQSYRKIARRYKVSDTTVVRLVRKAQEEAQA